MDTAIIITGFICLGLGIAVGLIAAGFYFSACVDSWKETLNCQADEISALNLNNLRLRGQCAELATQAHHSNDSVMYHLGELNVEISQHNITKRKLSAAKGQTTKLRKAVEIWKRAAKPADRDLTLAQLRQKLGIPE